MIASIIKKLFGTVSERIISSIKDELLKINKFEETMKSLSDEDLFNYKKKFNSMMNDDSSCTLDKILPEAFAVVREVSKRQLSMRHFDVQMIGGIVLHKGYIAEMNTGEGKTLVATLPAYLNSIKGNGVHIVTVNDYLAKRDSEWMRPIYESLDLSVACIYSGCSDEDKRNIYSCDVVYGTNNEFGFDYLRDNMKYSSDQVVQRELNYAIIDEVDSVLIDEARTPLIISGSADDVGDLCIVCNSIVSRLNEGQYEVDKSSHIAMLKDEGISFVEQELRKNLKEFKESQSLYDIESSEVLHRINQALRAVHCFKKDKDYIVHNNEALIIDEFTGRISEGRRYSDGLHQAIEAKEGIYVRKENIVLASITFQSFFKMYKKLSGMTGTAITEMNEFEDIYELKVCQIPSNRQTKRKDYDDEIFLSKEDKYEAIKKVVKGCHDKGQPVLIGTSSIENSEELSLVLSREGLKHSVLNAKYHESEAKIIAQAGRLFSITIATNMAGRGTDIMLGGNPKMLCEFCIEENSEKFKAIELSLEKEKEKVLDAGGLYVIGTERHESRRIDDQLRGRSGRQGDVGSSIFFVSMEDDLMKMFGTGRIAPFLQKLGMQKGESIKHSWINKSIERAQKKVEGRNYEMRKNLFKYDVVLDKQRKLLYSFRKSIMYADKDLLVAKILSTSRDVCENVLSSCCAGDQNEVSFDIAERKLNALFGLTIELNEKLSFQQALDVVTQEVKKFLEDKYCYVHPDLSFAIQKHIWLSSIDLFWSNHLVSASYLKESVGLRALGSKDPFNEFSREIFAIFERGLQMSLESIITKLARVEFSDSRDTDEEISHLIDKRNGSFNKTMTKNHNNKDCLNKVTSSELEVKSFSRNKICHCGSGIKYKRCCGKIK